MISKRRVWNGIGVASILLVVGITVAASGHWRGNDRADCPGKIKCPLTGELVCKDQCPLTDADRADCPGKIKCPLTGELVCKDQCPLAADTEHGDADKELPNCCAGKQ